jgi:DNA-binding NarL/FixJ family response regulator
VLEGVRSWLSRKPQTKVVGLAQDADEAAVKVRRLSPDIVIMDLSLPGSSGLHVMTRILAANSTIKVIIYSMHEDIEFVRASFEAGAKGYVLKSSPPSELLLAIEGVRAGGQHFDKRIRPKFRSKNSSRPRLSNVLKSQDRTRPELSEDKESSLERPARTSIERSGNGLAQDVMNYIEKNPSPLVSVKEIGKVLKIDPSDLERGFRRASGMTVKKHIDSMCKKQITKRVQDGVWKGTQLAEEFGFRSDQSFYRWIRRIFGLSFKDLRDQLCLPRSISTALLPVDSGKQDD